MGALPAAARTGGGRRRRRRLPGGAPGEAAARSWCCASSSDIWVRVAWGGQLRSNYETRKAVVRGAAAAASCQQRYHEPPAARPHAAAPSAAAGGACRGDGPWRHVAAPHSQLAVQVREGGVDVGEWPPLGARQGKARIVWGDEVGQGGRQCTAIGGARAGPPQRVAAAVLETTWTCPVNGTLPGGSRHWGRFFFVAPPL
jgi:hypothetical protein